MSQNSKRRAREFRGRKYYHLDGSWYDSETNMEVPRSLAGEISEHFAKTEWHFKYRKPPKKYHPNWEDWDEIPIMYRGGAPGLGKRK